MPDLHDDIRAAMEAQRSDDPSAINPGEANDDFAPQKSEVLPPVQPDNKEPASREAKSPATEGTGQTPPRGPDGKFQKAGGEVPPSQEAPSEEQPSDDDSDHFDPAKPPASWTKEMKAKWAGIPEDVRVEITRREEATAWGVQKLMQHYEPMEEIYNNFAQYGDYFNHIQVDIPAYINSMVTTEQTLRLGNPAQKMQAMLELADAYGVPLRGTLDAAMNGRLNEIMQQAHQHHKTPPQVPQAVQQELAQHRAWRAQVEDQMATSELEDFASEAGHEYLDYVREDMANLIESGVVETYQDAYDLACWRNPQIRFSMQANQNGQAQQNGVARRQAAAAAVVAPQAAALVDGGETPQPDDDLYDTVRKAWNTAASGRA